MVYFTVTINCNYDLSFLSLVNGNLDLIAWEKRASGAFWQKEDVNGFFSI